MLAGVTNAGKSAILGSWVVVFGRQVVFLLPAAGASVGLTP